MFVIVSVLVDVLHHARRRVQRLEHERVLREEERSARAEERTQVQHKALTGLSDVLRTAEVGDLLIVRDAGAYGSVMASNYNRRPSAEKVAAV